MSDSTEVGIESVDEPQEEEFRSTLIANYGLFWRRDWVNFETKGRGNAGKLLGKPTSQKRNKIEVDFRGQVGIYVLYTEGFEIVYIGQAGKTRTRSKTPNRTLFDRLKEHTRDHLAARWQLFSWFGIKMVECDGENYTLRGSIREIRAELSNVLDHFEAVLIHAAEPHLNRRGGNFNPGADQYLQVKDDTLDPPLDNRISRIEMLLEKRNEAVRG